jgi:hypothetical protein
VLLSLVAIVNARYRLLHVSCLVSRLLGACLGVLLRVHKGAGN